jgi:type VI secretion system secreted protein VgrG
MNMTLTTQIRTALIQFTATSRLYALTIDDAVTVDRDALLVEAFFANDEVHGVGVRDVIAVSMNASIPLEQLLNKKAVLEVSMANGQRTRFIGEVSEAAMLGSDGGFARYRLRLSPWLWRLGLVRNCRVWQDTTMIDIVDSVFKSYLPMARWRWSDEVTSFMQDAMPRRYCCQYRESDLDFVRRVLTEEGLGWRFEQNEDGLMAVMFANSTRPSAIPEDVSSKANSGIRFHRAHACEDQDTVQTLHLKRAMAVSLSTVLSYDYQSKQIRAASSPSLLNNGKRLPLLESFDTAGSSAYDTAKQACHYADLQMEGREARAHMWSGSSTVRSLRAGTRLKIFDTPLKQLGHAPAFTVLRVVSVGVNNMPPPAWHALAELFGPIPELLQESVLDDAPADFSLIVEQAQNTGYANYFEAIRSDVVWRPEMPGTDGRTHARPTASGSQTATVVGANGSDRPNGADELFCDRLGRVRIRFHWQDGTASCWVRVAQRSAGSGMGLQFMPRIGTEVLVQFLEGDIDRPVIVGALYNGQGEGGIAPTPGGRHLRESNIAYFSKAHDHGTSGQGNLAGGNSPVWHGASGDSAGHRNAAAQWGIRSKEFGGSGYNQLLFDDTDSQGRIQLKSSHAASELNLGHLIHAADNYRGSFRGLGAELRTDAYGAIRAGSGLLITSYKIAHLSSGRDPAGHNPAGVELLTQVTALGKALSTAAITHQTVALAAHVGTLAQDASVLDAEAPPLQALLAAVSEMVSDQSFEAAKADAGEKLSNSVTGNLPHTTDPVIAISAESGLGVCAGQSLQLVSGECLTTVSGGDMQLATGSQLRIHAGQAIGILGSTIKAGDQHTGLQLIAAKDPNVVEALRDTVTIQAREEVNVVSANAHVDWAAAKSISVSTAGGANITIEGGNITVQCPGKLVVHAGKQSLTGPANLDYPLPRLPREVCVECLLKALKSGSALSLK